MEAIAPEARGEGEKRMQLTIGSRESALAVAQSELVMAAIAAAHPDIDLRLVTMKTTGDRILDRSLDKIGGKGLFVKELDAALREGRVDLTVHSCKDLPMEETPDLPLAAFSQREDSRDALVLPLGASKIDWSRPIGCSSLRRKLQLQKLFPQARVEPVRGNVQSRLRKLDGGAFGALVLAAAGLKRLGLEGRVYRYFSPEEILPAAGQGILAVQCREGMDTAFLDCVRDREGTVCALTERAFVRALGGGCSSPTAAYAAVSGDMVRIEGLYVDEGGRLCRGSAEGPCVQGEALARQLALELKEGAVCQGK